MFRVQTSMHVFISTLEYVNFVVHNLDELWLENWKSCVESKGGNNLLRVSYIHALNMQCLFVANSV